MDINGIIIYISILYYISRLPYTLSKTPTVLCGLSIRCLVLYLAVPPITVEKTSQKYLISQRLGSSGKMVYSDSQT